MTGYNLRGGRYGNTQMFKDYYRLGSALNAMQKAAATGKWQWLELRTEGGRQIRRWDESKAVNS